MLHRLRSLARYGLVEAVEVGPRKEQAVKTEAAGVLRQVEMRW